MKKVLCCVLTVMLYFCGAAFAIQQPDTIGQAPVQTVYAANDDVMLTGGLIIDEINERIDYAYKVDNEYTNPYRLPGYLSSYTCGISAGGEIIGYFDRIYEDLIPNHTGKIILNKWRYGSLDDEVDAMYDSLYSKMSATPEGVTIKGYKAGIDSYVKGKGCSVSITSTMSGANTLNVSQYKNALKEGKLVSILLDGFTINDPDSFRTFDGYDTIYTYVNKGAHIMTAYGYRDVSYYNSANVCFRQDSYLYVNTGFTTPRLGLVKLNQYCTIDDCYIFNIY